MYFKGFAEQSCGGRTADPLIKNFESCPNNKVSHCIRLGAMRYEKVSHMCIFPSDGTDRIRFTGLDYKIHSQPDVSGSPKTYVLCDLGLL